MGSVILVLELIGQKALVINPNPEVELSREIDGLIGPLQPAAPVYMEYPLPLYIIFKCILINTS